MPSFALLVVSGGQAGALAWCLCAGLGLSLGLVAFSLDADHPDTVRPFVGELRVQHEHAVVLRDRQRARGPSRHLRDHPRDRHGRAGLTVLAWGNSIGDFVANLALVQSGGPSSVQIAWSGVASRALFSTSWWDWVFRWFSVVEHFPAAFTMPHDPALPWLLVFSCSSPGGVLIWLPSADMKLHKTLGLALIVSYCVFIGLRILNIVGVHLFGMT